MGTHPIFESDFDCLTERKATGKRKRNEPKVNYCHKIMPDGTNKSIFSDLDREECKEKKRRTGSKRKCTCKCLPGWKKGKSLDANGDKVILCTVPNMIIERKPKLVQIVDTAAELADKTAETKLRQMVNESVLLPRMTSSL